MKSPDVLILTASFGNGHNSATKALVEKIHSLFPDMHVVTQDLFEITSPILKTYLEDTYRLLTRTRIPIYNALYKLRSQRDNIIDDVVLKMGYGRFERYVDSLAPRMIISVFPTCAQFATRYKMKSSRTLKTVTVLTDVVGNWEWIHSNTDMYCVPAQKVKDELIEKGVNPASVFITGVPVSVRFKGLELKRHGRAVAKAKDDTKSEPLKRVLMLGSAMGKLNFTVKTLETLGEMPYAFTIVTGTDEELYGRMQQMRLPSNITLIGFTSELATLMKDSDLIITKPGGATIFEAIESNLPMLLQPTAVGQEQYNSQFVHRNGFGETYKNERDMFRLIHELLSVEDYQAAMIRNMHEFKASTEQDKVFSTFAKWIDLHGQGKGQKEGGLS